MICCWSAIPARSPDGLAIDQPVELPEELELDDEFDAADWAAAELMLELVPLSVSST
jgi:hypothetical protein